MVYAMNEDQNSSSTDDLGDYLREQQEAEFEASGWAPQAV
jgi:hypothetical protein